ncbi:MAG: hypothetical protein FJ247_13585 [Nitrospira sp.]|nr:hypothetical protein [Nitrospira sp.]
MNLFGGKRTISADQADRIKAWARTVFHLSDETTVMVTELECREPGCPPIETVIALLKGPGDTQQYKIHKTADEVGLSDIEQLAVGEESHHDQH